MSDLLPPTTPASPEPNAPATVTIRTFRDRVSAENSLDRLKYEGIEASILELAPPPGSPALNTSAVRIVVDAENASRAKKILLNQIKEMAPGAPSAGRRKPRPAHRAHTGPPWLFIIIALLGAGGAMYYLLYGSVSSKTGNAGAIRERYVNEDTNGDGKIDLRRYLAVSGQLIRQEIDVDYDEKWDQRMNYEFGVMKRRAADLDKNGIMDLEVFYDYLGRPFYSQIQMNGKGSVTKRTFFQEGIEFEDWEPTDDDPGPSEEEKAPAGGNSWPFRVLIDSDADGHFDLDQQLNLKGEVTSERALEKGAIENNAPAFPQPPGKKK